MTNVTAAVLEPVGEARIALESVDVQALLQGMLSEVSVMQSYRNEEDSSIEAVYTFPLPMDAVLLELSVTLGGKVLRGIVQPLAGAEACYEEAIESGDSAVLLQQVGPGIYTVNVGNILPGEPAVVRFRYSRLHSLKDGRLRFHVPTTIAPRYGDPAVAGLAPYQVPACTLNAGPRFSLVVRIQGALDQADIECPSHPMSISMEAGQKILTIGGSCVMMDRDFVLVLKPRSVIGLGGLCVRDGEQFVALASFCPRVPGEPLRSPRCIKLVVDCSGSMGGDSIRQAKIALHEVLSLLDPSDYFNLVAFGSTSELLFPEPVVANESNIGLTADFVERMDANMGGTEIGDALDAAYESFRNADMPSDVLLITDGSVWNHEEVIANAKKSGHRVFSVGVGSAVSEALVRDIATESGGACELVSPQENMAERIVRQFERLTQPMARSVRMVWPVSPVRRLPLDSRAVFAGDTLHLFAWFDQRPAGDVTLVTHFGDNAVSEQSIVISDSADQVAESDNVSRLAAHRLLNHLDDAEATSLAVQYQLVTEHTGCVLVLDREIDQKADAIPSLRQQPQMLAAGWGGMGSVCYSRQLGDGLRIGESTFECPTSTLSYSSDTEDYPEPPLFLRRGTAEHRENLVAALNLRYADLTTVRLDITSIAELIDLGLAQSMADRLLALVDQEFDEVSIVRAFLAHLADSEAGSDLSRHVHRLIRMANRNTAIPVARIESLSRLAELA